MDREEIIELANKAHAYIDRHFLVASSTGIASFEHFARLVAEREREECAKVCENLAKDRGMFHPDDEDFKNGVLAGAGMCAVTIRMRGQG